MKKYQHAEVKFNSGTGALLCNGCSIILAYGFKHKDVEHYCSNCEDENWQRQQTTTNKQGDI